MQQKVKIRTSTPTRIDLAGGTLDLYPLYLFEGGGLTVNCAINHFCSAVVEPRDDERIYIKSLDLNVREEYKNCEAILHNGPLDLVSRAVGFFKPETGISITTENGVHKGSGLGGSSSLLIAVMGALNEITESPYTLEQLIDIAANLEAQCIRIPTGKQDYYAAMYGGASGLWFNVFDNKRESLLSPGQFQELEERLILSFTGAPRFSGASNWNMLKNYIDQNPVTVSGMKQIKEISFAMRSCIMNQDWELFSVLIDREWQSRRNLAKGVSTEAVDKIMIAALNAGALANKLCGAGGGGCMITCIRPEDRANVEAALTSAGAEVLPFHLVQEGMKIERQHMEKQ